MRKIKVLLAAIAVLFCSSLYAKDFDWSECWCNYGGGIEQGDMILSVEGGLAPYFYTSLVPNYWAIPTVVVDFEVAQPIWKLPFTFGGYAGFGMYGYNGSYTYSYTDFYTGGKVAYHVMLPPKNLDVYVATKIGFVISAYNTSDAHYARTTLPFNVDVGELIGASWYFNDFIGINLELGYPICKFGAVFKF